MYAYVGIADRCPFRLTFAPFWCIICVKMSKIILCKNVIFACDINTFKEIFMKKRILIATLAIAVIIASMAALAACNINLNNIEVDSKTEMSADDLDGSKQICDEFLQNTFASDNYVMAITGDDSSYVLKLDGTKKMRQDANLTTIYFIQDGKYYVANINEVGGSYSETSKEMYDEALDLENQNFREPYLAIIDNPTYTCSMREEGKATTDGFKGTGTLNLTISNGSDQLVYSATAKDGRVETFTRKRVIDGVTTNSTATMTYGNASITLDLEHWTNLDEQ